MSLHELVKRTYDKILKPFIKIEVLSDKGWEEIDSLNIGYSNDIYEVQTDNDKLICTGDHILIDLNGNEIFAKDVNNKIITNKQQNQLVKSVKKLDKQHYKVYDLSLKGSNHLFYANNLLSHNCLIIDEMAFIPKNIIDDFFASVVPIVSSSKSSKIIAVSTPNGAEGLYYELWQKANSGHNDEGWMPFRIYWWEVPNRDEKWKKQQIATIGLERWKQEYECDFLTSATKRLIPDDIIDKYRIKLGEMKAANKEFLDGKKTKVVSPDETKLYEFTMWHEFDPECTYVASGDCAEGSGGDSSVLYVWDISDLREIRMCAKFESSKVSLTEFAFITSKILSLYNNPYYICERNGIGAGYIDMLKINYQYENLVIEGKNNALGVYSHVSVKSKACLWTRDMMTTEGFGFKLYDKSLIDEMSTFVKKETKGIYLTYTALTGAHDDHIMAFIWLCYLLQSDIIEKYFVVCQTFTSSIGNIYAQIVKPQTAYTMQDVKKITDDPIYQDFLEFKNQVLNKLHATMTLENKEKDQFVYNNQSQDIYFGGYNDGPNWNTPQFSQQLMSAQALNANNRMPVFFIN